MKTKKSLILLALLSLAVTSCSFAPVRRPRNSSSNGDTISEKDSGGQNSNNKRAPTLVRDDYDVVEYLKLDDNLNVIGLNYVPDDGVLFIDYPISSYAFYNISGIETVFLGPRCYYLDQCAFYCCNDIKYVIIDSDSFPKLNNDTFCGTWDPDYFHVYVNDEIYDDVLNNETDDILWNDNCERVLRKKSELPSSFYSELAFYTRVTNTLIEYKVHFNDPDKTIDHINVLLLKDGRMSASYEYAFLEGGFGVTPNTSYTVRIEYFYDLDDGYGERFDVALKDVKTRKTITPYLIITNDSSEQLNIDSSGYVTGLNSSPSNGILFINHPIRSNAFVSELGFHTVVINQGCDYIGECAFSCCDNLRTVIINRDSMPTLVNDTFCVTWDPEDFKVYVPDEYYNAMKNTNTADELWNSDHRNRQVYKFSDLPQDKLELTESNIKVTNNSISFSFPLYDPDGAVHEVQIYLYDGDMLFASIDRGTDYVISDNFTQLNSNTTYRLNIHLGYYLVEGGQHFYLDYNINVTTLSN